MAKLRTCLLIVFCLSLLAGASPRTPQSIEALMGTALRQEEVEGNIEAAIATYKKVIAADGVSRALAATAQYRIGLCYEKLGNTEARRAFEQVLSNYQDQKETVALARARLNALDASGSKGNEGQGLSLRQIKIDPGIIGPPSPDGRYIAYGDRGNDVAVYDLTSGTSRKITHSDNKSSEYPLNFAWSPDGNRLAYDWYKVQDNSYDLRIVGLDGSQPRILYKSGRESQVVDLEWFPDGKSLAVTFDYPCRIVRISVEDGDIQIIQAISDRAAPAFIAISPDGRYVAYDSMPGIFVVPATGGEAMAIVNERSEARLFGWDREGHSLLFTSDRSGTLDLWRVAIVNGKPQAEPGLVAPNIGNVRAEGCTPEGSCFYSLRGRQDDIYIATLDRTAGRLVIPPKRINSTHIGSCASPSWSRDGEYVAYLAAASPSERSSYSKVCIWSADNGSQKEFLLDRALSIIGHPGSWTLDGQFLQARVRDNYRTDLVHVSTANGDVSIIATSQKGAIPEWGSGLLVDWTSDASRIFWLSSVSPGATAVFTTEIPSGRVREVYRSAESSRLLTLGKPLSPDGKWLALSLDSQNQSKSTSRKLVAIPTEAGVARDLATFDSRGPHALEWSQDSKYVLYVMGTELWEVPLEGGPPRKLGLEMRGLSQISLNPDGRRIAFKAGGSRPNEIWVIENIPPLKK